MTIPQEVRDKHNEVCEKCEARKLYAKYIDVHFDWLDCPYDCENDFEHWKGETDEDTN